MDKEKYYVKIKQGLGYMRTTHVLYANFYPDIHDLKQQYILIVEGSILPLFV